MICTIPPLFINYDDCVGDSLGKYNYNFLLFDTLICNLSSALFTQDDNIDYVVTELNDIFTKYDTARYIITEEKTKNIELAATTVSLLSSFWTFFDFSVQLPINGISLTQNDLTIIAPTLSTVNAQNIQSISDTTLKNLSLTYLNTYFSAYQYPNNTVVNVNCPLYNIVPALTDLISEDPLIKPTYNPTNTFSYNNRSIDVTFNRDNVFTSTGVILRFFVQDKKWNYIGYIHDIDKASAVPNQNTPAFFEITPITSKSSNNEQVFLNPCNTINVNEWYSASTYIFASGVYSGISSKLGTVSITFRTADNKTSIFTHTAKGYDPTTNTGGTDVYLEFDGNVINAYEQYPTKKTLIKSLPYPYKGVNGVNFKYTNDGKGVLFKACASVKAL